MYPCSVMRVCRLGSRLRVTRASSKSRIQVQYRAQVLLYELLMSWDCLADSLPLNFEPVPKKSEDWLSYSFHLSQSHRTELGGCTRLVGEDCGRMRSK